MSIRDYKITDAQFSEKGVIAAPDTLTGTAAENKGVFDRFAREIIAPQFNAIVDKFADMEESANNWSANEAQRVQQENVRQTAEQGRVSAEGQRSTNETARLSAEENRISAENDRVTAETARVNAENKRDSAEKSRVSAENARNFWQTYDASKAYVPGNKVSFGGSSYVCTAATVGHEPTDTAYWLLIAQKGADGAGADDLRQINDALDAIDPTKITTKAAPADGDGVMIADSADGGKAKRLLWSNVKAALGKLFVPLARKVNGKTLTEDVTLTAADIKMPDSEEDVGAAMAKRAMNHSEAIPQNDCDFITNVGVYRGYNDTKNMNNDDIGTIVVSLPWDYNSRQQIVFVAGGKHIFHRAKTPASWGEYTEIAQCVAPEVHELPLAAGWTKFDATCRYYKTQESIVIVSIAARTTQSFRESAALATLPEGFRPAADLEVPAIFKGSRRLVTIKATADGNLFVDLTDQSGVAITSDDYFFATFAFMS